MCVKGARRVQMELLNKYPTAELKVYSVWFNMYPGDRRSKWRADLLQDPRVTHYWDQKKKVGRHMAQHPDIDYPRSILWDAYLLFGPDAIWEEQPEALEGWGMPLYHRRRKLMKEITPFIEIEPLRERVEEKVETGKINEVPQSTRMAKSYDLMVVGGGGAGFAAAIRGAELGKQVALVEEGVIGGVCVNVGCVPSKTLLRAAEIYRLGEVNPFSPAIEVETNADWPALIAHKDRVVADMRKTRYEDVLAAYPEITLLRGRARLLGENRVEITPTGGGQPSLFTPGKIVIATGSHSWAPPIEGLEQAGYLDSTAAFELEQLPSSMIIVGASAAGLEIGQLFSRFGTKVTMVEIQDDILPEEDSEISGQLIDYLREEDIAIETNFFITEVSRDGEGYRLLGRKEGEDRVLEAESLLMATGRHPNTPEMGLDEAGVELGARGEIIVDEHLRTENPHVYAAGDVLGDAMFVYSAAYGGKLAADNALEGAGRIYDLDALPRVTFTDPAVAAVGLTESEAYDREHEVKVTSIPIELLSRAQVNGDTRGLIKLVADKTTDRLLGAHVLSAEAGEVIQAATFAIKAGMTVADLRDTLFPYLTFSEGLKLAALSFDKDPALLSCCAG